MSTTLSQRLRDLRDVLMSEESDTPNVMNLVDDCIAQAEAQEAQAGELSDEVIDSEVEQWFKNPKHDLYTDHGHTRYFARHIRDHGYLKPSQAIGEQRPVVRYSITHAAGILPPWGIEHTQLRFNSRGEAAAVCNELNNRSPLSPEARDRAISAIECVQATLQSRGEEWLIDGKDYLSDALSALRGQTSGT